MKQFFKRNLLVLQIIAFVLMSCSSTTKILDRPALPFTLEVLKDTREVVMVQDKPWENQMMGYLKVLRIRPDFWQMWYSSWDDRRKDDYSGYLVYAYSKDGKHWTKEIPGKKNNILRGSGDPEKDGIVEQDLFIDESKPFKYQMIYTAKDLTDKQREKTFIEESKDGINWVNKRVLWNEKHDSQFSVIQRRGKYYIYNRYWEVFKGTRYRTIGLTVTDRNWKTLEPQKNVLTSDFEGSFPHLYNPGASKVSDNLDILFPTFFNEKSNAIKFGVAYHYKGNFAITNLDITNDLLEGQNSNWGIIAPGLIPAGKDTYWIYYYATNMVHSDYDKAGRKFRYYRIQVKISERKSH